MNKRVAIFLILATSSSLHLAAQESTDHYARLRALSAERAFPMVNPGELFLLEELLDDEINATAASDILASAEIKDPSSSGFIQHSTSSASNTSRTYSNVSSSAIYSASNSTFQNSAMYNSLSTTDSYASQTSIPALNLGHFEKALKEHPTAERFIIKKHSSGSFYITTPPSSIGDKVIAPLRKLTGEEAEENQTIMRALKMTLEQDGLRDSFPFFDYHMNRSSSLSSDKLAEILAYHKARPRTSQEEVKNIFSGQPIHQKSLDQRAYEQLNELSYNIAIKKSQINAARGLNDKDNDIHHLKDYQTPLDKLDSTSINHGIRERNAKNIAHAAQYAGQAVIAAKKISDDFQDMVLGLSLKAVTLIDPTIASQASQEEIENWNLHRNFQRARNNNLQDHADFESTTPLLSKKETVTDKKKPTDHQE